MGEDRQKAAAASRLTRYIEEHSMRKTPERFVILDKVFEVAGHFTVESIFRRMIAEGYRVSKVTVYNAISLFVETGIVRKRSCGSSKTRKDESNGGGGGVCYERTTGVTSHYHLVCSRCGKVREKKDSELERLLLSRKYGTFQPEYSDLYIYGYCSSCKKQIAIQSNPSDTQTPISSTKNNRRKKDES